MHPRVIRSQDYHHWSIPYNTASRRKEYFPASRVTLCVDGERDMQIVVGVSEHLSVDMLLGQDVPKFKRYLREARKVSDRKGEEMTSPISTPIEVEMVTTRAQQLTVTQREEEEALTQERGGPVIHTLDPCYNGKQTEESEGKDKEMAIPSPQPEPELERRKGVQPLDDGAILAPQLSQISLFDTLNPDQLRSAQREDPSWEKIRSKASKTDGTYFWKEELLLRTTYQTVGEGGDLIIVPHAARSKVLSLAHNTPVTGHFGRERILAMIRQWMDFRDWQRTWRSCAGLVRSTRGRAQQWWPKLHTTPCQSAINLSKEWLWVYLAHCEERRPETSISW